jgi:hypothetical protein
VARQSYRLASAQFHSKCEKEARAFDRMKRGYDGKESFFSMASGKTETCLFDLNMNKNLLFHSAFCLDNTFHLEVNENYSP